MQITHPQLSKPGWLRELIAIWGYAQRNYYLTKRYFMWEVVWLVYSTMNALTIGFIGVGFGGDENVVE
jgi:ABC-2 type transport system permease protein